MGLIQVNEAIAHRVVGDTDGLAAKFDEAVANLSNRSEPVAAPALVQARAAQASLALSEERYEDARSAAQHGLVLLQQPMLRLPGPDPEATLGLFLGVAELKLGYRQEGTERLQQMITRLQPTLSAGAIETTIVAEALNQLDAETWDSVLAEIDHSQDLVDHLTLSRQWPDTQLQQQVEALVELHERSGDAPYPVIGANSTEDGWEGLNRRFVQEAIRQQRESSSGLFDDVWAQVAGDLPAWLTVDPALEPVLVAWINNDDLAGSRDYLQANPSLLSDDTEILLGEFEYDGRSSKIELYVDLIRSARRVGIPATFDPLLAEQLFDDWVNAEDFSAFVDEHPEVTSPALAAFLAGQLAGPAPGPLDEYMESDRTLAAAAAGFLELIGRDERSLAEEALNSPVDLLPHYRQSVRIGDHRRLGATAAIALVSTARTPRSTIEAAVATAIAWALSDSSLASLASTMVESLQEMEADQISEMRHLVTQALQHNPTAAADLAPLLGHLDPES